MALEPKFETEEQDGCKIVRFYETTGDYDANDNPGGFGAPNLASADVTQVILVITPIGDTAGYTFTFTVAANTITAATVTDPQGTVTDILADLSSNIYPFTEGAGGLDIIGDWLGFGEDSEITSYGYNIEYTVSDGTTSYTFDQDELWVCQICCCVRNAAMELEATNCDCQKDKLNNAINSQIFLDSAIWSMEAGDEDKAVANLMFAKQLCEGKCTNC